MKNIDTPAGAFAVSGTRGQTTARYPGFTKREAACLALRLPASGDPDLDALIRLANQQEQTQRTHP